MAKNTNLAKGLTGKKWSKKVMKKRAEKGAKPLVLNKIGTPHNVIFTRDISRESDYPEIQVWDTSNQVKKAGGQWFQIYPDHWSGVSPIQMPLKLFKALFDYILPKGKAVNGRISLCGGLRTR